jgi:phosphoribosylformylglycinamidine synthase subunit PurS
VPTIVVEVMPKAELLDPQGKAVAGALARTGRGRVTAVRATVQEIADEILSNSVIEDVVGIHYPAEVDA